MQSAQLKELFDHQQRCAELFAYFAKLPDLPKGYSLCLHVTAGPGMSIISTFTGEAGKKNLFPWLREAFGEHAPDNLFFYDTWEGIPGVFWSSYKLAGVPEFKLTFAIT